MTYEKDYGNNDLLGPAYWNQTSTWNIDGPLAFYSTNLTYWECAAGLFTLWILFRICVVISLTLQDQSCHLSHDANDTRNINV